MKITYQMVALDEMKRLLRQPGTSLPVARSMLEGWINALMPIALAQRQAQDDLDALLRGVTPKNVRPDILDPERILAAGHPEQPIVRADSEWPRRFVSSRPDPESQPPEQLP